MATYNKFNDYTNQLDRGTHAWATHSFKIALSNTAPTAANSILTDITQITAANGYVAGGNATTITVSTATGTSTVQGTQVVFTATGAVGPFQYAVLYNDTAASKNLVAWWDYGSAVTLANGDTFTVQFNSASPGTIFTAV